MHRAGKKSEKKHTSSAVMLPPDHYHDLIEWYVISVAESEEDTGVVTPGCREMLRALVKCFAHSDSANQWIEKLCKDGTYGLKKPGYCSHCNTAIDMQGLTFYALHLMHRHPALDVKAELQKIYNADRVRYDYVCSVDLDHEHLSRPSDCSRDEDDDDEDQDEDDNDEDEDEDGDNEPE
jgi:hypothetical protein